MKKITYPIFIILWYSTLSTPLSAEDNFPLQKTNYDKKWEDCNLSEDCVKTEGICFSADAINKNYLRNYKNYVTYTMWSIKCSLPSEAEKASDLLKVATCQENKCVLENPK